jgi:hypothetical protein
MVQKMCTHVCKSKNDTCSNNSRNGGVKVKGVNSPMIYLTLCKNFCKCHNVPSPPTTIKNNLVK